MSRDYKPHLRCPECRLHRSVCICGDLPRLETRTRVVVLVHQLELGKTTNTGLVAARCLANSTVAYHGRPPAGVTASPPPAAAHMLYPHPEAIPLDALAASTAAPLTLVIPDGTWSQAARMRTRTGLPCVTLPDALATGARMRTAGQPGRLATLEAIALALGVLEGPAGPAVEQALLRVFRMFTERTLWTNGRVTAAGVTGGIPAGARPHDPLGPTGVDRPSRRDRRSSSAS